LTIASPDERYQIRTPGDAANLLMGEILSLLEQEEMRVVMLDTRQPRDRHHHRLFRAASTPRLVRVGELFREAIPPQCRRRHHRPQSSLG